MSATLILLLRVDLQVQHDPLSHLTPSKYKLEAGGAAYGQKQQRIKKTQLPPFDKSQDAGFFTIEKNHLATA